MLRDPSPRIRQEDPLGAETACTFQLFYIHGHYTATDEEIAAYDFLIGWRKLGGDRQSLNLLQILRRGFEVHELSSVDPNRFLGEDGQNYLKSIWQKDGIPEEYITQELARSFPIAKKRALHKLQVVRQFPRQYIRRPLDARPQDIITLLQDGWHVACDITTDSNEPHRVLLLPRTREGKYVVFDPIDGISQLTDEKLQRIVRPRAQAYR